MRIAWTTDLHLNFVSPPDIDRFIQELRNVSADAVLVEAMSAKHAIHSMPTSSVHSSRYIAIRVRNS